MSERKLIPYEEAMHLLGGIGKTTFFHLMKEGRLDRVKLGTRGFVTKESVDRLIAALTAETVRERHGTTQPYDVPIDGIERLREE